MRNWSLMRKLIWLHQAIGGAASWAWDIVTGSAPLSLPSALAKGIKKLTQYGKTVQSTTPTPSSPQNIVCNNGVVKWDSVNQRIYTDGTDEVLTISTISSIQSGNIVDAKGLDSRTGVVISNSDRCYTMLGYYPAGTTVVQRATDNKLGGYLYMYNSDTPSSESFIETATMGTAVEIDGWYERSATSTSDGYLFIQSLVNKASVLSINWSATQPSQTASVVDLYSVGDITDEQEIISGAVTHRISCHVFDGTESFSKSSAYGQAFLINAASAAWGADRTASVLCTHFLGLPQVKSSQDDNTCFFNQTGHFYFRVTDNSDANAFKTWLTEQYAAGTPVIVWFVLAESTTESVTAQHLATAVGDNTVSVVSNVDPVDLEVEYAKSGE